MTDITKLAQSLKAAVDKATPGSWRAFQYHDGRCGIGGGHHDEIMVCEHISKRRPHDAEFIAMANPANTLALVEALEKAQQRIAELESRTVTVKLASRRLPSDYVDGEFGNDDLAAIHNACRLECKVSVEKYLSAHGIVVKLEDE
ncbi:ead/Ea22-like family protein [Klebsiella pneumoniae]|uniref:ead/Ea22-like family protein n=1 Tax=Klebsiella pneumoniae TaxID=573 RepID=UPI00244D386A|nr:ead/Ea22-like family protein [Klebsiella pneumoniae]WGI10215.1 ead/Ea22-like family protein [Klebsiella pneumoniae]